MNKTSVCSSVAGILLTLSGVIAIAVGVGLVVSPAGDGFHISVTSLVNTPFSSYFIPGLLIILFGIGSICSGIWELGNHRFSGFASILMGTLLVSITMISRYLVTATSDLQVFCFILGLVEMGIGILVVNHSIQNGTFKRYHKPYGI